MFIICISIICGAIYNTTYAEKILEKSVLVIKINEKNIKLSTTNKELAVIEAKKKATTKALAEKNVKAGEKQKVKVQNESSRKVVVIDPGHASVTSFEKELRAPGSTIMKIKEPGGAQGINTKTPEYVVNMEVAVRLRSLLQGKGYTVIMTKTQNSQMLGNIVRAGVGNKANADLVIRIHADSNNNSSVNGASMLVPTDTKNTDAIYIKSKKYGQIVFNTLIRDVGMNNGGVVERSDMTGFNWSKVPVILVEMGFQSNASEDKLLTTNTYQAKIAKALSEGIDQALK